MPDIKEKLIELLEEASAKMDCPQMAEIANYLLANGVTVQEWISVSERLPKNYISVNYSADTGYITHWMPLPELPKEA